MDSPTFSAQFIVHPHTFLPELTADQVDEYFKLSAMDCKDQRSRLTDAPSATYSTCRSFSPSSSCSSPFCDFSTGPSDSDRFKWEVEMQIQAITDELNYIEARVLDDFYEDLFEISSREMSIDSKVNCQSSQDEFNIDLDTIECPFRTNFF